MQNGAKREGRPWWRKNGREELCHMNNEPALLEVEQRIKWVEDKFEADKWMKDARLHVRPVHAQRLIAGITKNSFVTTILKERSRRDILKKI
jgi:hypothetical protein